MRVFPFFQVTIVRFSSYIIFTYYFLKMSQLNRDILFLLFEELQDDSKSLFSCLLVNRLWCETVVPILWRDPWRFKDSVNYQKKSSLYYIITFSLSNDIKEFLTSQGTQLFPISHQSLLFDYLSFCRSINTDAIKNIISIGSSSTYSLNRPFWWTNLSAKIIRKN